MIAREVYAEGRVFSIQQSDLESDQAAGEEEQKPAAASEESFSPSPAAPGHR